PDVRQRPAVRQEMLVHHGVVHAGEAVGGEAGGQLVRRVERARIGRVRHVDELRYHMGTAPDQVRLDRAGAEPAADEERVTDLYPGQVRRVGVQAQALDGQPGQGTGGQVQVQLGAGLDLVR